MILLVSRKEICSLYETVTFDPVEICLPRVSLSQPSALRRVYSYWLNVIDKLDAAQSINQWFEIFY